MYNLETILNNIQDSHKRITKTRRHIIELLLEKPMTMNDLFESMNRLGYPHKQTIYNNLIFLEEEHILKTRLNHQQKEYFIQTEAASVHLNILCEEGREVTTSIKNKMLEQLKSLLHLDHFDINQLEINIEGVCKHPASCQKGCLLKAYPHH